MNPITSAPLFLYRAGMAWESDRTADPALRQLKEEWQAAQSLFRQQTAETCDWINFQAAHIAGALLEHRAAVRFRLPERIAFEEENCGKMRILEVPAEYRDQNIGGRLRKIPGGDLRAEIRRRLLHLEQSPFLAVAESAKLLRFAMAQHLIRDRFPHTELRGRSPVHEKSELDATADPNSGCVSPDLSFDPSALANLQRVEESVRYAEERLAALKRYIAALNLAVSLAPYVFTDETYQGARSDVTAQLAGQGQAISSLQTGMIIGKIIRRAAAGQLDRGLSLSLPYFDDQTMEMRLYAFEVIPKGRVPFVPAFVVLAARREQDRVAQEFHGSDSTRMHLLAELKEMEQAFGGPNQPK